MMYVCPECDSRNVINKEPNGFTECNSCSYRDTSNKFKLKEMSMENEGIKKMSIVRKNLMEKRGYTPYCGDSIGECSLPRTYFNGEQFVCRRCGWVSDFPTEFIQQYKNKWRLIMENEGIQKGIKDWNQEIDRSIIPMVISETGKDGEPIKEVIVCDGISGDACYKNNMPEELRLTRILEDGTEYSMDYEQRIKDEMVSESE